MTDTPTPPAEAVEIAARAMDLPDYRATAALTALAAAGWTLTPPPVDRGKELTDILMHWFPSAAPTLVSEAVALMRREAHAAKERAEILPTTAYRGVEARIDEALLRAGIPATDTDDLDTNRAFVRVTIGAQPGLQAFGYLNIIMETGEPIVGDGFHGQGGWTDGFGIY
jgi:hypothetical protein